MIRNMLIRSLFAVIVVTCILPPVVVFLSSFIGSSELSQIYTSTKAFHWRPLNLTMSGYDTLLFSSTAYLRTFWNTMIVAVCSAFLHVMISLCVGYALARTRLQQAKWLIGLYTLMMLIPFQAILLPTYMISSFLGIDNTWWSIILPQAFMPMGVVFVYQFVKYLPQETVEAAVLDTSSVGVVLLRVVAPGVSPCLVTLFLLTFADTWNAFEQPLVLIEGISKQLLSVQLYQLSQESINVRFSGAVFYFLPVLILYVLGKEHILQCLEVWYGGDMK